MEGTEVVRCSGAEPEIRFYRALREATAELEQALTRDCLYCPLPYDSMHVTAWDGIAADGLNRVPEEERAAWETLLRELPGALHSELLSGIAPFRLGSDWRLDFALQEPAIWGDSVLVARLQPTGRAAERALAELIHHRRSLDEVWKARREPPRHPYAPHVSLGYFANPHSCALAKACLAQHTRSISDVLAGEVLSFRSASLYGFTDMATFFRLREVENRAG